MKNFEGGKKLFDPGEKTGQKSIGPISPTDLCKEKKVFSKEI